MLYQDQSDENLVMLTLAGEQCAYEVLVRRYERMVLAVAQGITGNQFLAEDAAQDAFVTAWMKLNILRESQKYNAWVCRIVRNCALNLVTRYQSYLALEDVENYYFDEVHLQNPAEIYLVKDKNTMVNQSVSLLPEKVREIIRLHYFEGLSIPEIAERMQIHQGTVKSQLHDGRKKLRRELCAMSEEINDTLLTKIWKKVEELKNWQFVNSKKGFEDVYKEVLQAAEELPESEKKNHALADVLMRGYWWLPGEKNDMLFARIEKAAKQGKNDEVMRFIVQRQDDKIYGTDKIDYIRNTQIPKLEQAGFVKALGSEWFWLGCAYFRGYREDEDISYADAEKGFEAYTKALHILAKEDIYYWYTQAVKNLQEKYLQEYVGQEKKENNYRLFMDTEEFRFREGELCRYDYKMFGQGSMQSVKLRTDLILYMASDCDGYLTKKNLSVGESYQGSDGTILTFAKENVLVSTPAGNFENCRVWKMKRANCTVETYYKEGVGIVKQITIQDGMKENRWLKSYHIKGGEGLLPVAVGNTWEYTGDYQPEVMQQDTQLQVSYVNGTKVVFTHNVIIERKKYDENSWRDMILEIRNEYFDGSKVCDVTNAIKRAESLASTPMEKAHTKAACSVARRILETNPGFNPDYTASGHWNFFVRSGVVNKGDMLTSERQHRWSFELKSVNGTPAQNALLYSNVYDILQCITGTLWADKWLEEMRITEEFFLWERYCIHTEIISEKEVTVDTKAGHFENCLKLTINTRGFDDGPNYLNGRKEYFFAEGIGIVKVNNYYCHDALCAIYELSAYEGTGQGYMPIADGMVRRYKGVNLTDGHVAWAEYTYVAEEEGEIVIFSDICGIKKKPEIITDYGTIYSEILEDDLWEQGDRAAARERHGINNLNILIHLLGKNACYGKAERSLVWNEYRIKQVEGLDYGEGIPKAWYGFYAKLCISTAATFGGSCRRKECYEYLEKAFTYLEKWMQIEDGSALELGNQWMFGDIKLIKGKNVIELPDGKREPILNAYFFDVRESYPYYALTMPRGWEWFNDVRNEERYKEFVERARQLADG